MDEATLCRALDLDLSPPNSAHRLTALVQAMTEVTDELDGLSSRLALIARALTELHHLAKNKARAQMSTRERLQDSASNDGTDGPMDEAIQEEAGEAGARCGQCDSILPISDRVGWLCAPCEIMLERDPDRQEDDAAAEDDREGCHGTPRQSSEGASAASAGGAGPTPLADFEVLP